MWAVLGASTIDDVGQLLAGLGDRLTGQEMTCTDCHFTYHTYKQRRRRPRLCSGVALARAAPYGPRRLLARPAGRQAAQRRPPRPGPYWHALPQGWSRLHTLGPQRAEHGRRQPRQRPPRSPLHTQNPPRRRIDPVCQRRSLPPRPVAKPALAPRGEGRAGACSHRRSLSVDGCVCGDVEGSVA